MPFNLNAQYHIIQEALTKYALFYNNYKLRTCFHTYFEEDLTLIHPENAEWEWVISCLCKKLYTKNYTNQDFEEKVFKREYAATTAFGNIAIPHSVDMDAIKTSIALAISQKDFDGAEIRYTWYFCLPLIRLIRKISAFFMKRCSPNLASI